MTPRSCRRAERLDVEHCTRPGRLEWAPGPIGDHWTAQAGPVALEAWIQGGLRKRYPLWAWRSGDASGLASDRDDAIIAAERAAADLLCDGLLALGGGVEAVRAIYRYPRKEGRAA